jgi:hypothetical protein
MDKLKPCPFCGSEAAKSSDDPEYVMCSNWDCHLNSGLAKALPRDAWNTRHTDETGGETPEQELTRAIEYAKGWIKKLGHESQPGGHIFDVILELANCRLSPSQPTEEEMEAAAILQAEIYDVSDGYFADARQQFPAIDGFVSGFKAACKWMGERK